MTNSTRPATATLLATAALLALALSTVTAQAQTRIDDGTVLISPEGAAAGGVSVGDTAGFPITISKSGSYRLTGTLVVPAGVDAFKFADGVTARIDLGGFSVLGPAICSASTNCLNSYGTAGIRTMGSKTHVAVFNGRISGFSQAGIAGTSSGTVTLDDLRLTNNGHGVDVGTVAANRVVARDNAGTGFVTLVAQIVDSRAESNGVNGFWANYGIVRGSIATSNNGWGFAMPTNLVGVRVMWLNNYAGMNGAGGSNAPGQMGSTNMF